MSQKLFIPLEQLKKGLNLNLSEKSRDEDALTYLLAAQDWAASYCKRDWDGQLLRTEYYSGNKERILSLKNFPVRSVSELNVDSTFEFEASTEISSDDFAIDSENGSIRLKEFALERGESNVKVSYFGGYIAEKSLVGPSAPSAATFADALAALGQSFTLFLKTTGTATAATVTITGTDENGAAQTEVLTPLATDLTTGKSTFTQSRSKWKTVAGLDSSALVTGKVELTACSMPSDLRLAIQNLAVWLYKIDQQGLMGKKSRSTQGVSESIEVDDPPPHVLRVLNLHRNLRF